jgi:transcriptional antiterminator RfaH
MRSAESQNTRVLPGGAQSQGTLATERQDRSATDNQFHRWYVAQTHVHAELVASRHLNRQGFDVYLPRYLKQRRHARRMDIVAAPLFPRYLFVAIDMSAQRWRSINSTLGVVRLISIGDDPVPIPQAVFDELKRREDASGFIQLERRPRFSPGDKIRVVEGTFSDCYGLFEGMSGKERVAILLDLLGRKVRVLLNSEIIDAA